MSGDANSEPDGTNRRDAESSAPGADGETVDWPVSLAGVTESVVTTLGPNGRWNAAALGLFAGAPVTATTWGNTRTRRNFHRQGEGYVQFTVDPIDFVDAACSITEFDEPVLESANAWVRVRAEPIDSGVEDGTEWERWELHPIKAETVSAVVPTIDRGFGAVIDATVAASRLGVEGYDEDDLRNRLEYAASAVERAGSPRERAALERVREYSEW
jgi:uncharacterized protein